MVQLLFYGGFSNSVLAQTSSAIDVENQEEGQIGNVAIGQDQKMETGNHTDYIVQNQDVTGEDEQHVYDGNEEWSQENKDNHPIKQEQSIELAVEQGQTVSDVDQVEAEQEQNVTVESNQLLKVEQKKAQSQHTKIVTDQNQSFSTEHKTDYLEQTVEAEIHTEQENRTDKIGDSNDSSQDSTIHVRQSHQSETSGQATVQQNQSVEVQADYDQTEEEEGRVTAATSNGLKVIKEVTHFVVRIFQSIMVNDEEVDSFEEELVVDHNEVEKEQKYSRTFDWGSLSILNKVRVNQNNDSDLQSSLESIIDLNFFAHYNKNDDDEDIPGKESPERPEDEGPKEEVPAAPGKEGLNEEAPGTSGEEGPNEEVPTTGEGSSSENNPQSSEKYSKSINLSKGDTPIVRNKSINHDWDNDGVPNQLEIHKFKTNPYKADTDGDGLSDHFEIVFHSEISFLFTLECMEYDWKHFVSDSGDNISEEEKEKQKHIKLNPLISDTNNNGILDHEEDFDQDGLNHEKEQEKETNPYINNENGQYYGPSGVEFYISALNGELISEC